MFLFIAIKEGRKMIFRGFRSRDGGPFRQDVSAGGIFLQYRKAINFKRRKSSEKKKLSAYFSLRTGYLKRHETHRNYRSQSLRVYSLPRERLYPAVA
jgi:hypothetical protein